MNNEQKCVEFTELSEQSRRSCDLLLLKASYDCQIFSPSTVGFQAWWVKVEQLLSSTELVQSSLGHCPTQHPRLWTGGRCIWWLDHLVDQEWAGWLLSKGGSQWLNVQVETRMSAAPWGWHQDWCCSAWTVGLSAPQQFCWWHRPLWCGGHSGGKGWRRQSSGKTLDPLPLPKGGTSELERDFLQGHGGTGQGEWL